LGSTTALAAKGKIIKTNAIRLIVRSDLDMVATPALSGSVRSGENPTGAERLPWPGHLHKQKTGTDHPA
jgi:hypothetical protein